MRKQTRTRGLRKVLEQMGCQRVGTEGSHEKWQTPGGLSDTIVCDKDQSPGVLRHIQRTFAAEFGEQWLEKELGS